MRSNNTNRLETVTGDGIIMVVDELIKLRHRIKKDDYIRLVDHFIDHQCGRNATPLRGQLKTHYLKLLNIVATTRHSI